MGVGVGRLAPAAFILIVLAAPAAAQEEELFRGCRRGDLIGAWRVVRFGFATGASVDRTDPAYLPHQQYVFHANATMAYRAWETAPTAEQQRALRAEPASVTWAVDGRGRLLRQSPGAVRLETSECRVIVRALNDPKSPVPGLPGDVVLTDQDEQARPITRRLLRKLEAEE